MKNKLLLGLGLITLLLTHPVFAQKLLTEIQLKNCIYYDEMMDKKESNIENLEDAIRDIKKILNSYDYKLDRIDSQLSYTTGNQRTVLINNFNSINHKKNDYIGLYNTAVNKQKLRFKQFKNYLDKYQDNCEGVSLNKKIYDNVCKNKDSNYCDLFNY